MLFFLNVVQNYVIYKIEICFGIFHSRLFYSNSFNIHSIYCIAFINILYYVTKFCIQKINRALY